eukprot:s1260_g4.t1
MIHLDISTSKTTFIVQRLPRYATQAQLRFSWVPRKPFARNEVRSSKPEVKLALGRRLVAVTPRLFCVAGVARGDICVTFGRQAWHLVTSTSLSCDGLGRRLVGAWSALGRRLVAVTPRLF